jgi:hypothetical protein
MQSVRVAIDKSTLPDLRSTIAALYSETSETDDN